MIGYDTDKSRRAAAATAGRRGTARWFVPGNVLALLILLMASSLARAEVIDISPDAARQKALAGEIVVVDVRTPEEWRASGLPDVAIGIDMRRSDFVRVLRQLQARLGDTPIAYICSAAGRSTGLTYNLDMAGFENVVNIREGVFGNRDGPGWLGRGLPMRAFGTPPHPNVDAGLAPAE